jgi:hypothetical protein
MKIKPGPSLIIFFSVLIVLISTSVVYSEEENINATVYPRKGEPMIIENISRYDKGPKYFFTAVWRGSNVKLYFHEISSVTFLNRDLKSEIIFNDGRKDKFKITGGQRMRGKSEFGDWKMYCANMTKIEFGTMGLVNTPKAANPNELDQILFKNGDLLSGEIKTRTFKLRASYATLAFERTEISHIEFEGGGQNIDTVVLHGGDILSGVLEAPIVEVLTKSGKEINLDKEKIKKLMFKIN